MTFVPVNPFNFCLDLQPRQQLFRQLSSSPPHSVPFVVNTLPLSQTDITSRFHPDIFLSPTPTTVNKITDPTMTNFANRLNFNPQSPVFIVMPNGELHTKSFNVASRPVGTVQKHSPVTAPFVAINPGEQLYQGPAGGFVPVPFMTSDNTPRDDNITHIIVLQNNEKLNDKNCSFFKNGNNIGIDASFPSQIPALISTKSSSINSNCTVSEKSTESLMKRESQNEALLGSLTKSENSKQYSVHNATDGLTKGRNESSKELLKINNTGTPSRKYECKECNKVFNNRHNLSHHMRYHRNDRRFKCEDCEKAFFQKIHLIEHRRIHTGEKPHECPHCGRRFRHSTNLKRHVKSIHLNELFGCHLCTQSFKRKATLKRHVLKIHSES